MLRRWPSEFDRDDLNKAGSGIGFSVNRAAGRFERAAVIRAQLDLKHRQPRIAADFDEIGLVEILHDQLTWCAGDIAKIQCFGCGADVESTATCHCRPY